MLYSVDTQSEIKSIPHRAEFDVWRNRLSSQEYDAIVSELQHRIESDEIHTSSWIPGGDWTDTVFQPIYKRACHCDPVAAAKCFGLILWKVLLDNEDFWGFGRYDKNGIPIQGLTYFKLGRRP